MATAKDGSKHHSNTRARMHDEKMDEEKKAKPAPKEGGEPEAKEPKAAKPGNHAEPDGDEGMGEDSTEPIEGVVAEHGPAEKMEMHHKDGVMHMTTHHGGMEHKTSHTDPMAMGHHMMKAMGHTPPPNAPAPAAPGMGGDATGMGMGGGGGIPGMM